MPLLKPFKALYYNQAVVKDLSLVTCPPYDVMDYQQAQRFKQSNSYNFCNILLTDNAHDYRQLGRHFRGWCDNEILIEDRRPCFYLYLQRFIYGHKKYRRFGLLGLLKIDKEGVVFPHEYTFVSPKKDRYALLKETETNLSPIFTFLLN